MDPKSSLPPLMGELERVEKAVGFRIKYAKSKIVNITLPKVNQTYLEQGFPFMWALQGVTYLGLQILPMLEYTIDSNYVKLLQGAREDLIPWKKYLLSWLGRLAAVKMSQLPKLLYVMQTLPLQPLPSVIAKLRLTDDFIWGGKKVRITGKYVYLGLRTWAD
ncbi:hypothetical protein NDU88_002048 [Pleurodeles waltl]|uniref:Reverse transcriptase n=1 Tax=Pleurodeles waltl TaxID=8319 RepID=A0AAV7LEV3_PLEWA|nr:hypothetical protein NDU88_002048 [Pleurodeles waltl]